MPKVIGTCMVSNEADIIEAFVRHNLQFLDALVILDHASVDSTYSILEKLGGGNGFTSSSSRTRSWHFTKGDARHTSPGVTWPN